MLPLSPNPKCAAYGSIFKSYIYLGGKVIIRRFSFPNFREEAQRQYEEERRKKREKEEYQREKMREGIRWKINLHFLWEKELC